MDNQSKNEWQWEKTRIEHVVKQVNQRIQQEDKVLENRKNMVADIRASFWDQVTMNLSNDQEIMETYASIQQESSVLADQERNLLLVQGSLSTLHRLHDSPYFGRVDFKEQSEEMGEAIYIGLASFYDEEQEAFLIFDWRAPICSLFYDHSPGEVHYSAPDGDIYGTMELKRQFVIQQSELRHMFNTDLTIGDEFLQEALSDNASTHMKSIVATIQKQQNQIIRDENSRLLIVQGTAGSGKTSAALQRIAYLLYRYRGSIESSQIVLFSPNPLFNSFVSRVLPELGEVNMQQLTFHELLSDHVSRSFHLEDLFEQTEFVLHGEEQEGFAIRMEAIQYKASTHFFQTMNQYFALLENQKMQFRNIKFRGNVIISKKELEEQFYSGTDHSKLNYRIERLQQWILQQFKQLEKEEWNKAWVQEEVELLDKDAYQSIYAKLKQQGEFEKDSFRDNENESRMLSEYVVRKHLSPLRRKIKKLQFINFVGLYKALWQDAALFQKVSPDGELCLHWKEIGDMTCQHLNNKEMLYEDATPFVYLREYIQGFQGVANQIKHIIIDEAQDYSPFQFAFITKMYPRSKMTVLGDLNQAIFLQTTNVNGFEELIHIFGKDNAQSIYLNKSYRSTKEIVEFTRELLPDGKWIEPFERHGEKPIMIEVKGAMDRGRLIVEDVNTLLQACNTIGIICKTAEACKEAYEQLNKQIAMHLVDKKSKTLQPGVTVIPSYLAKGIEFDAVIIYDGSKQKYSFERDRKLFYTVCTRAMHFLHIYHLGEITPFIRK